MYPDYVLMQLGHARQTEDLEAAEMEALRRLARTAHRPVWPANTRAARPTLGARLAAWLRHSAPRQPAPDPAA